MMNNEQRARLGHAAIKAGAADFEHQEISESVLDTLANLMHCCRSLEVDMFDEALESARINFEAEACSKCGGDTGDGEGYDGLCGNCADKVESCECGRSSHECATIDDPEQDHQDL